MKQYLLYITIDIGENIYWCVIMFDWYIILQIYAKSSSISWKWTMMKWDYSVEGCTKHGERVILSHC